MTNMPPEFSKFDRDPEALAWARGKVQEYLDRLTEFEAKADKNRNAVMAYSCNVARELTKKHFLGDGGCTMGVFDERLSRIAAHDEESLPPDAGSGE